MPAARPAAAKAGSWINNISSHVASVNVGVDGAQGEFVLHHAPPGIAAPPRPRITTHQAAATVSTNHAGDTRMTLRNRGNPSGFSGVVAPFIRTAMRRAVRKDLAALKQLLERDQRDG